MVDLGSGAGNDAFIACSITGQSGKVIGVDFTEKMIEKVRINAEKLAFTNVEFRQGDIENLPLVGNLADIRTLPSHIRLEYKLNEAAFSVLMIQKVLTKL